MTFALGPGRRLRAHREFLRAQRSGRRVSSDHFVLLVSARAAGAEAPKPPRLGLVVSRKVGGAVCRNRVKRICREAFRTWPELLPFGVDLVVIARSGAGRLSSAEVRAEWLCVHRLLRERATEALAPERSSDHLRSSEDRPTGRAKPPKTSE